MPNIMSESMKAFFLNIMNRELLHECRRELTMKEETTGVTRAQVVYRRTLKPERLAFLCYGALTNRHYNNKASSRLLKRYY